MHTYQVPIRLGRLASAEVAERPSGIPEHAKLVVLAQEVQEWPESTLLENVVTARRAVSSNVAQCPDSLFTNVRNGRGQELDELRNSLSVDHNLSMLGSARRDVGQGPRSLELRERLGTRQGTKFVGYHTPAAWHCRLGGTRQSAARRHTQ